MLALGDDVVMLNDHARQALSPADQAELISRATEALAADSGGRPGAAGRMTVDLPSGAVARMSCHPLALTDGVVHVKLLAAATPAGEPIGGRGPTALPGLVGSSAAWRRACRTAEESYQRGEWLTLEGEPGVGKLALVRAVHQHRHPTAPFHVIDVAAADQDDQGDQGDRRCRPDDWLAQARAELPAGAGTVVFRHVHALSGRQLRALAGVLAETKARAQANGGQQELQVAVTLDRAAATADLTGLLRLFPGTVEVPPLRHHGEDLRELVPFFLGRLGQQARVSCSPAAMQLLLRHTWPGNAAQLWQVLRQVAQRRRTGQILPADLPPECWTVSRRVLSAARVDRARRDRRGPARPRREQDHGRPRARHVPRDDLPAHPRLRDRHPVRISMRGARPGRRETGRVPRS